VSHACDNDVMGLFDDLRMASGLGLEPAEAYKRAYEKGVLLGPTHFAVAGDLFQTAAQQLQAVNGAMAYRAMANAHVYRYLARRDPQSGTLAAQTLAQVQWIEVPGTVDEIMEGPKLGAEIHARLLEDQARHASVGGQGAADLFRRAAQAWVPLLTWRPVTFELLPEDVYTEDGTARFFLNAGNAAWHDAQARAADDPDIGAEYYALAAQAFGRCGANDLRAQARERLKAVRLERPCWFCGRAVRGFGDNLRVLSAGASDYFVKLAHADRERGEALEQESRGIYACSVCAGAVDRIAEARAQAVRAEVTAMGARLTAAVTALESRVGHLEGFRRLG
jgi:hypothetical protein